MTQVRPEFQLSDTPVVKQPDGWPGGTGLAGLRSDDYRLGSAGEEADTSSCSAQQGAPSRGWLRQIGSVGGTFDPDRSCQVLSLQPRLLTNGITLLLVVGRQWLQPSWFLDVWAALPLLTG